MSAGQVLSKILPFLRKVLDSSSPLALSDAPGRFESTRGLAQGKTLVRGFRP